MKQMKKIGVFKKSLMVLSAAMLCVVGGLFSAQVSAAGANVIQNGDFADGDVSAWTVASGAAAIETAVADSPIYGEVKTYGVIKNRTASYECFAQDITASVQNGKEYAYEFYCMLSDDYAGAPADQRVVEFAPYVTVNGTTTYLGSWSGEITGTASQSLTPGEWTKYSGTFTVDFGDGLEQVVIRLLEQGTNYGAGNCVKGEYYVTGVSLKEVVKEAMVLEDVVPVKDAITAAMGEDIIVGGAATTFELRDKGVEAILRKHFNAVTLGNEMKPDAMFGYSGTCPKPQEITFNGKKVIVPTLDYSRAEKMLDTIYNWNQEDPENALKVRGHVLVWHSQTPEWFFHEDCDASKPYASKEEMNLRLEWYIKTVLEHFTGPDSKYKDMFYGWDVVNEAVSDSSGYRKDTENSSWWAVYQSNEFIINAFKYANKYAPADLKLYYNDYNDSVFNKVQSIVQLLQDVKNAEGTRIDGMGMQAHYDVSSPGVTNFKIAVKAYLDVVDEVQLTEWDLKSTAKDYSTQAAINAEYERLGFRYYNLYQAILELKNEGYNITGMTFWGNIDKFSWLQTTSNVGGGMTSNSRQFPMLFDDDYKVKPAYWAFVDSEKIKLETPVEEPVEESEEPTEETVSEESVAESTEEASTEANAPVEEEITEEGGMSPVVIVIIAVVVGAAAGAGFYFFKKNKKK